MWHRVLLTHYAAQQQQNHYVNPLWIITHFADMFFIQANLINYTNYMLHNRFLYLRRVRNTELLNQSLNCAVSYIDTCIVKKKRGAFRWLVFLFCSIPILLWINVRSIYAYLQQQEIG